MTQKDSGTADDTEKAGQSSSEDTPDGIQSLVSPSAKSTQKGSKKRCGGLWTEARYNSFIKGALRAASVRWPPRYQCMHEAFIERAINPATGRLAKLYRCKKCEGAFPAANMEVNHIIPVVPTSGFDSWDGVVERLFCEKDGLEALCKTCHKKVTKEENQQRKEIKNA